MYNILLTGVGGQGTVLAAKLLAQTADAHGWQVRTAETIGMAQRGGSVISHIRIGSLNEPVHEPLIGAREANLIIAFEPAEAVRVLPYLACDGAVVTASSAVQPVTAALSDNPYQAADVLEYLKTTQTRLIAVDDEALCHELGSRKVLNTILLASALSAMAQQQQKQQGAESVEIGVEDLKDAIRALVKPQFVDLNLRAIDLVTHVQNDEQTQ